MDYTLSQIKKIRKENNFTQEYMAKKLFIGRESYSKIENGITKLDIERLENISAILGVPISELVNDNKNLIFLFYIVLPNNNSELYQWGVKDFNNDIKDAWDALEYIEKKTGAIKGKGEVVCFSFNDYMPESLTRIFKS